MAETDAERRRFRPTLWPTVFTVPALVLLLVLGTWQVQRLHWKEGLIAERAAAYAAEPLPIGRIADATPIPEFRRVRATGVFEHGREMLLDPRSFKGRPGAHVVTPLRLDGGGIVLVDRGWVPRPLRDPATRLAGQVAGRVEVTGILRTDGRKSDWIPENQPDKGNWYYVDVRQMAASAGITGVRPWFIEAGAASNPGGWPLGGHTLTPLPNNHLAYAFTWYAFALVLTVIYFIYHLKDGQPKRGREDNDGIS